jgi:hypothetical protein
MNHLSGKTRVLPDLLSDFMREGRKFSAEQRLEDALYQAVMASELQVRSRRFLPQQAIKAALRKATAESKREGSCVLANGQRVIVTHIEHGLSNARGFA